MRTLDRLIRIIYKELPLSEFMNNKKDSCLDKTCMLEFGFDLKSREFKEIIKQKYLEIYPQNYSADEIDYTIDHVCQLIEGKYGLSKPKLSTIKILLYVAEELLFLNSNEVKVDFDDLLELNGIINKLDGNVLFAAKLALENKVVETFQKYRILHNNERLTRILEKGIAENHMHLKGSGYTAEMNWLAFSNHPDLAFKEFEEIINSRNVLAPTKEIISSYKIRFVKAYLMAKLELGEEQCQKREGKIWNKKEMQEIISYTSLERYELLFAKHKEKINFWQGVYYDKYKKYEESDKKYFLSEREFLRDLFKLFLCGKMDEFTHYLFNCYIMAATKFKLYFYQDNVGMGFEKFKYSENIKESLIWQRGSVSVYQTVFDKYYEEGNIKKIEFRIAPKDSASDYVKLMKDIRIADEKVRKNLMISEENKIKYGFIIHYIKDKSDFNKKEGISRKEESYHVIDQKSAALISFFDQYDNIKRNLKDDILVDDEYRNKIVGIDTANYEFNCRPEIFGYSFRRQRKEIYSSHKLNFTYHVGEDFTNLLNGLRAIDEVIEFLGFGRGDRFGHSLALGLEVEKYYATKRNIIHTTAEDYMDDLVWLRYFLEEEDMAELNCFIKDSSYTVQGILRFLEDEFSLYFSKYHLEKLGPENYSIWDYQCAYRLRGDYPLVYGEIEKAYHEQKKSKDYSHENFYRKMTQRYSEKLNSINKKHRDCFLNPKARKLFYYYHFSAHFKEFHEIKVKLEVKDIYITAVKLAQYALRKKVYRNEIGIESNPSSNRKIAFISKYIDLPFLHFNKTHLDESAQYDLSTTINSDDSGIFQTDLSLEYAYVVATLNREGFDMESIYRYIEYMRENSMVQSFVLEDNIRRQEFKRKRKS